MNSLQDLRNFWWWEEWWWSRGKTYVVGTYVTYWWCQLNGQKWTFWPKSWKNRAEFHNKKSWWNMRSGTNTSLRKCNPRVFQMVCHPQYSQTLNHVLWSPNWTRNHAWKTKTNYFNFSETLNILISLTFHVPHNFRLPLHWSWYEIQYFAMLMSFAIFQIEKKI